MNTVSKAAIIVIAVGIVATTLYCLYWRQFIDPSLATPGDAPANHAADGTQGETNPAGPNSASWTAHLEHGNPVRFIAGARVIETIPLSPPLESTQKATLASQFTALCEKTQSELMELRASTDDRTAAWLQQEASLITRLARSRAVLAALAADRYAIVPSNQECPTTIADGVVVFGNRVTQNGKRADVRFFLRFDDYPELALAYNNAKATGEYAKDDFCYTFNGLPNEERAKRIDEHFAAEKDIARLESALLSSDAGAHQALAEEARMKRRSLLPSYVVIDRQTLLVRPR